MELYVEDVFLVNFAVDLCLFWLVERLVLSEVKVVRSLLLSLVGGVFGVVFPYLYSSLILRILSVISFAFFGLLYLGFRRSKLAYGCVFLLAISVILEGFISLFAADLLLFERLDKWIFYLLLGLFLTFILSVLTVRSIKNSRALRGFLYAVELENLGKKLKFKGFLDSGNLLENSFGEGFLIANFFDVIDLLKSPNFLDFPRLSVNTVGSFGVFRIAKISKMVIYGEGFSHTYNNVNIAMSLSEIKNGQMDVILSPKFFAEGERYEKAIE